MPTGLTIHVNIDGGLKKLRTLVRQIAPAQLLTLIGMRQLKWINDNFRAQGLETPWKPLSPNTIAARRQGKGRGGAQALMNTGRLRQSFVAYGVRVGGSAVTVGTADTRAPYHQYGTAPHRIEAKNAKALRFFVAAPIGGRRNRFMLFRRGVNHPGNVARPMLPSPRLARQLAVEELRATLDRATKLADTA